MIFENAILFLKKSFIAEKQYGGENFTPFGPTHETELLRRGGLHRHSRHRHAHHARQSLAHPDDVWRQFRPLHGDGDVCIPESVTMVSNQFHSPAQQDFAVYTLEFVGSVREMFPDIAECQSPEQRIAKRMYRHIPVRMRYTSDFAFNPHAAEP